MNDERSVTALINPRTKEFCHGLLQKGGKKKKEGKKGKIKEYEAETEVNSEK